MNANPASDPEGGKGRPDMSFNTGEGTAVLRYDGHIITSGWLLLVELGARAWKQLLLTPKEEA
jgi:hypothetical protein